MEVMVKYTASGLEDRSAWRNGPFLDFFHDDAQRTAGLILQKLAAERFIPLLHLLADSFMT